MDVIIFSSWNGAPIIRTDRIWANTLLVETEREGDEQKRDAFRVVMFCYGPREDV